MTERKDKYGTIESCGACSLAAPSERVTRQIEQLEVRLEDLEAENDEDRKQHDRHEPSEPRRGNEIFHSVKPVPPYPTGS